MIAASLRILFPGIKIGPEPWDECVIGERGIVVWNRPEPQPTPADIAAAAPAAQAAWEAAEAERIAAAADRAELKAQFQADLAKLSEIVTTPGGTNAARDSQLQDLARVQRRLLKAVKALVL